MVFPIVSGLILHYSIVQNLNSFLNSVGTKFEQAEILVKNFVFGLDLLYSAMHCTVLYATATIVKYQNSRQNEKSTKKHINIVLI